MRALHDDQQDAKSTFLDVFFGLLVHLGKDSKSSPLGGSLERFALGPAAIWEVSLGISATDDLVLPCVPGFPCLGQFVSRRRRLGSPRMHHLVHRPGTGPSALVSSTTSFLHLRCFNFIGSSFSVVF